MKVLFLDHDGVIVTSKQFGTRFTKQKHIRKKGQSFSNLSVHHRFDNFDKKAVSILNDVLLRTNAEIVISSDWKKHATLEEMKEYYKSQGVVKMPLAYTPSLKNSENRNDLEDIRVTEIKQFLESNEVTSWVCVDDLNLSSLDNFVHCPRVREGIKQTGIKDKILTFLLNHDEKVDRLYNGDIPMTVLINNNTVKK